MLGLESKNRPRVGVVRCGRLAQQHHLSTLLVYLERSGFDVKLFALQCPVEDVRCFCAENPEIKVEQVGEWSGKGVSRFLIGGLALSRSLRIEDLDLIYVVDSWTLRYFAVALFLFPKLRKTNYVYHTFDMLAPDAAAWYERLLERLMVRGAALNVVTDRSRAALMKALYRLPVEPLSVAVRLLHDFLQPPNDAVTSRRASLLPIGCKFLIVSPTRLSEERVGKAIIRAASLLPTNYAMVMFAGDADYTQECIQLANALDLGSRLIVLPESPHSEVLLVCAASNVALVFHDESSSLGNFFCHPSRLSYCVALGIPVVANAVPSIEAVIYKYQLGLCAGARDAEAVASALRVVCEGAESREQMEERIKRTFLRDLTFELDGASLITDLLGLISDVKKDKH